MKLDVQTLAYMQSLIFIIQVTVLYIQYRVNRTYPGIDWWVSGSAVMAVGVVFMRLIRVKSLLVLAMMANPLFVLGHFLLYAGVVFFVGQKFHRKILLSCYGAFIILYYFFIFFDNNLSARTVVIFTTLTLVSLMTAFTLLLNKERFISFTANFTAAVFLIYGVFFAIRVFIAIILPPMNTYSDQQAILVAGFIAPIISSTLWTFGFIMMVNQRLNEATNMENIKMQQIFNTSPDASLITRMQDGLIVDVNVGFTAMSGYSRSDVVGTSTLSTRLWHHEEDREVFLDELSKHGVCENMEFVFVRKDGSLLQGIISARLTPIYSEPHIISVIHDITERKRAEEALRESEETYRSILNASPDDITITDLDGNILMVSPAAKSMFGYELNYDELKGKRLLDFIIPEDIPRALENIKLMYGSGGSKPNEYRALRRDGTLFHIEVNSSLVKSINGKPAKMVFIVRDITNRKSAELQIQHLIHQLELERNTAQLNSITDSLTGLSNRRHLDEALNTEFHRMKRSGSELSIIMLDVDNFKNFNDTYGHLAGDNCLRRISKTLQSMVLRITDVLARYGGEEFIIVLPDTGVDGAKALAERIKAAIEALAIPNSDNNNFGVVTVSLGVAVVDPQHMELPEQAVAKADAAMYIAKKKGRNRVEVL